MSLLLAHSLLSLDLGISSGNLENERVEKMIGKRN